MHTHEQPVQTYERPIHTHEQPVQTHELKYNCTPWSRLCTESFQAKRRKERNNFTDEEFDKYHFSQRARFIPTIINHMVMVWTLDMIEWKGHIASVLFLASTQSSSLLIKKQGWRDGSLSKGPATKADDLSSIPRTYMTEGENQLPRVVSSDFHMCT